MDDDRYNHFARIIGMIFGNACLSVSYHKIQHTKTQPISEFGSDQFVKLVPGKNPHHRNLCVCVNGENILLE